MPELVTSPRNPRVSVAARLHRARDRREQGRTLLEGPHLLAAAIAGGVIPIEVFGLEGDTASRDLAVDSGSIWIPVTQAVLDRLAATDSPRGPVAVIQLPPPASPERDLLWCDLADPGNAGTLIRTGAAFALDVVAGPGAADPWSPKVLRSAAGAHFATRIGAGDPPAGWGTIATVVEGGVDPAAMPGILDPGRRWAVLVGSEAHGLAPSRAAAADLAVTIAMPGGIESLNAAVAGAIVAHHLSAWRSAAGSPAGPR